MQVSLEQIFNIEGSHKEFNYSFTPDFSLSDDFCLTSPVSFEGKVVNTAGIVTLEGQAVFTAAVMCSRCAEEFSKTFEVSVEHTLVSELNDEDNDEFYLVENKELDLDALICEDTVLSLPFTFLCKEDCKGICPQCGQNLNNGACACKKPVDPRLAALLDFDFDD